MARFPLGMYTLPDGVRTRHDGSKSTPSSVGLPVTRPFIRLIVGLRGGTSGGAEGGTPSRRQLSDYACTLILARRSTRKHLIDDDASSLKCPASQLSFESSISSEISVFTENALFSTIFFTIHNPIACARRFEDNNLFNCSQLTLNNHSSPAPSTPGFFWRA